MSECISTAAPGEDPIQICRRFVELVNEELCGYAPDEVSKPHHAARYAFAGIDTTVSAWAPAEERRKSFSDSELFDVTRKLIAALEAFYEADMPSSVLDAIADAKQVIPDIQNVEPEF